MYAIVPTVLRYVVILAVVLTATGGFFMSVQIAEAVDTGIVACTGARGEAEIPCGTCELIETFNNAIDFLITLASVIATIALVVVGLKLVTSGGSETAREQTKQTLWYIVMGMFFIIASYAIITVVINALVPDDSKEHGIILNWRNFSECIYEADSARPNIDKIAGGVYTGNAAVDSYCASKPSDGRCQDLRAGKTVGGLRSRQADGGLQVGADLPEVPEEALCNSEYLNEHFPGEEKVAACVLQGETSCGADFYSTTDKAADGTPFSISAWQVNLTVWDIEAQDNCSTGPVKCTDAFSGGNYSSRLVNPDIYNKCVEAMRDTGCAGRVAERIRKEQGWGAWSAYTNNNCR